MLAGLIDGWKNRGLTPTQVPAGEAAVFANGSGGKLYALYQERLKILNAADFGDLLLENIRLFREHPDVLRQYQQRFHYILVDEYQDTNVAQYLWLRLLAQAPPPSRASLPGHDPAMRSNPGEGALHRSRLSGCGDAPSPDPRAASGDERAGCACYAPPRPRPQKHLLRRRRRPVDLWLARRRGRQHPALRARFPRRQGHPARAQLPLHRPYPRRRLASDRAQRRPARQDAAHRGRRRREGHGHRRLGLRGGSPRRSARRSSSCSAQGHKLNEIAILVRASFQMREFEDRFVTLGLPYRVIGGPRFYERAEDPRRARLSCA